MTQVFDPSEDPQNIADAVLAYGYAAIEGYTSVAVPCCTKVISALRQYDDVCPVQSYQNVPNRGYLYLVVDTNISALSDPNLHEAVRKLDEDDPGGP